MKRTSAPEPGDKKREMEKKKEMEKEKEKEKEPGRSKKVLILGGTGEMGQWFTPFFREEGYEVTIWGKGGKVEIAERLGVPYAFDLEAAISESDIVIVSVPISVTEKTIAETAPKMKEGSLLMDLTSTKVRPLEAMKKFAPAGVEVLGTHPMFGPTIPGIRGQTVILVPGEGYSEKWFPEIKELFERKGAHVQVTTAAEHDRLVSVVQGLTHFAYISIGTTVEKLGFDVKRSRKFVSPVYDIMLDFVGRILGQNPYLYALIQMENPAVLEVHEAFISECERLSDLVKAHDLEGFAGAMKAASRHYGDTAHALRRSDKLINTRIAESETLLNSVGKPFGFYHVYSEKTHVGILEKVSPDEVTLSKLPSKGTAPEIKQGTLRLKLENLRFLSYEELRAWKKENLQHTKRDLSVLIPRGADPEVILQVIAGNCHLAAAEISDIYPEVPGTDMPGVTFRITVLGD
ncbi:MAG: prephenate dehydrogenase, partial [Methanosarcinaceae archaeon]|nr:prephenate dehydrogenase [Methanosarcinaceae archaeon]